MHQKSQTKGSGVYVHTLKHKGVCRQEQTGTGADSLQAENCKSAFQGQSDKGNLGTPSLAESGHSGVAMQGFPRPA